MMLIRLTDKHIKNFWAKVDIQGVDDCWLWKAGTSRGGYGSVSFNGRGYRATRIAWMLANGRMPMPHLDICHSCDNPKCCNPNHLWEGTRQQNLQDAARKGRIKSQRQKLTAEQVKAIRQMTGKQEDIARLFGVHPATISKIASRHLWRTLD